MFAFPSFPRSLPGSRGGAVPAPTAVSRSGSRPRIIPNTPWNTRPARTRRIEQWSGRVSLTSESLRRHETLVCKLSSARAPPTHRGPATDRWLSARSRYVCLTRRALWLWLCPARGRRRSRRRDGRSTDPTDATRHVTRLATCERREYAADVHGTVLSYTVYDRRGFGVDLCFRKFD